MRGPRGRLAMPNELPSINKDFHFTSLHFTSENGLANQSQTLCGAKLGMENEIMHKWSRSHKQDGHHGYK